MAQTESPTAKLYEDMAKAMKGDAYDTITHIALETAACDGFDEDTAAPATEETEAWYARGAVTESLQTTTNTNDTYRCSHQFTFGATGGTEKGFHCMTADTGGESHGWCCFAADVVGQENDQLTCQMDFQFKKGA